MQYFAIFSPTMGEREDFPYILIHNAFTSDNTNVQIWDGEVRSDKMRVKEIIDGSSVLVPMPDGNPVKEYFTHKRFVGSTYTEYLLAFTKANIYYWQSGIYSWTSLSPTGFTLGTTAEYWVIKAFGDGVVATNNLDIPISWDGDTANKFVGLGDAANGPEVSSGVYIERAAALAVHENYIILGGVKTTTQEEPNSIYWCANKDETNWIYSGASAGQAAVPGAGRITAIGVKREHFYVFKDMSIRRFWLTTEDYVWLSESHNDFVGTKAPGSLAQDADDNLYYYATDMAFREIDDGKISQAIDPTARNINPSQEALNKIRATFIAEYSELWWSVPYAAATENDKTLKYSQGRWTERDIGITAFGAYNRIATWTIDTIPFDTIDEIGWTTIDSTEGSEGFPVDICGDENGNTFTCHTSNNDRGSSFASKFVLSTDFANKQALNFFKRLLNLRIYARNEGSGSLTVEIKRDGGSAWESAGTVSLNGSGDFVIVDLPVDFRARHFLIRISSTDPFRFIGLVAGFVPSGEWLN